MNLAVILAWLAPLICFASAVSDQEQSIGVEATEIPVLVQASGDLRFVPFVPKVENRANISVSLAVPMSAISHLSSGNLTVYVMLKPKRSDSQLYFGRNPQAKEHYLTLNCTLVDGACAPGSATNRTVGVYFSAPTEASLSGDEIIVRASLSPFLAEQSPVSGEFSVDPVAYSHAVSLWEQASNPPQSSQAAAAVQTFAVQTQKSGAGSGNSSSGQLQGQKEASESTPVQTGGRLLSYSAAAGSGKDSGRLSVEASQPVATTGMSILQPEPTLANFLILATVLLAVLKADAIVQLWRDWRGTRLR